MRSVKQQSDNIKRLAILARSLLPLPHKSSHGISQLVSIVRFLSNRHARWNSFFNLQLLLHNLIYPNQTMSILARKNKSQTNCLMMVEMSFPTISTMSKGDLPQLSTTTHQSYHRIIQLASEYSKISIQLSSWAKISFFDLKLLLNSAATLEVRTKDQSLSNCTSQQVADNIRGHVNGGLS